MPDDVICSYCHQPIIPKKTHYCTWESNGKIFGRCARCKRIIRLDSWFGDLHLCK